MLKSIVSQVLPYLPPKLVWLVSKNYIAGETVADAMRVANSLNAQGARVSLDILGEFIERMDQADTSAQMYMRLVDQTVAGGIKGNFSLKPTMFGLLIDEEACYRNIRQVVARAAQNGRSVRIDMEDSACVDLEINLYRKIKAEFPNSCGLVMQAYLYRTLDDLKAIMDIHTKDAPVNIRLCKGIYRESPSVAIQDYHKVRTNFLDLLEFMLGNDLYIAIATHDSYLVEHAIDLLRKYNTPKDRYEFQMLYGVTPKLRQTIISRGHHMRVYVPFGKEWFKYATRRLKENPDIAGHIINGLLFGRK